MYNEVLKGLILLFMSEFQIKGSSKGDSRPRHMAFWAIALLTVLPGHGICNPLEPRLELSSPNEPLYTETPYC